MLLTMSTLQSLYLFIIQIIKYLAIICFVIAIIISYVVVVSIGRYALAHVPYTYVYYRDVPIIGSAYQL